MIDAKLDTRKLARSIKGWAKDFGETNETALAKLSAETCRQLAAKTQPWGTGIKARKKIEGAIAKDVRKSVRTVPNDYFNDLLAQRKRSVKWRNQWVTIKVSDLLMSETTLNNHVESMRTAKRGKVDSRQISPNNLKVAAEDVAGRTIAKRIQKAGIAKGAWVLAGRELTEMVRRGPATAAAMKRQGIGKRYMNWAQKAARASGTRGFATPIKNLWRPQMKVSNRARHTASPRILSKGEINKAILASFRKLKRNYEQAFHAMDKRNTTK